MSYIRLWKTPYGIFRLLQMLLAIGEFIAMSQSKFCQVEIDIKTITVTCVLTLLFDIIFVLLWKFGVLEYLANLFNVGFLVFVIDLIFTIYYATLIIHTLYSIPDCDGSGKYERMATVVFIMLNYICFFSCASADFHWLHSNFQPF